MGHGSRMIRVRQKHHQGSPAIEVDAAREHEAVRAIGGERGIGLRRQQSRQDHVRAGREQAPHRRGQPLERRQQNIGEHEIITAVRLHDRDPRRHAVVPHVAPGDPHHGRIDVARQHAAAPQLRGRHGQHARAGAEIQGGARRGASAAALGQRIERQQAAARGAVMAGAESERGLDFHANGVDRHAGAVVLAVHHETAGGDRLQALEAGLDPVARRHAGRPQRARRLLACDFFDQAAQARQVGPPGEMQLHRPAAVGLGDERRRRVLGQRVLDRGHETLGGCLVGGEPGKVGLMNRLARHDLFARSRAVVAAILALLLAASGAAAQNYPARRITLVVPYTAGSGFDSVGRTVAQKFSERFGQPVIVDNRSGASATLGTDMVANAPPDGYTLLLTGTPLTLTPSLSKAARFDPVTDFTPLGNVATSGLALTVTESFPVTSLQEFLAEVRANPGKLNYSSPGSGTLQHLGMELFKQQLGLDVVHVPYRGAASAITDLITGQVQFTFLPVHTARPLVASGKLRMLAVAAQKRSPFAPEVPTLAELGYPGIDLELWYGFFAPANLPEPIARLWEGELAAISAMPDVRESFERQGLAPVYWDAVTTAARVKTEVVRWRGVIERAGIKAE